MWAELTFVLSQSTRLTDRQTDGFLMAIPCVALYAFAPQKLSVDIKNTMLNVLLCVLTVYRQLDSLCFKISFNALIHSVFFGFSLFVPVGLCAHFCCAAKWFFSFVYMYWVYNNKKYWEKTTDNSISASLSLSGHFKLTQPRNATSPMGWMQG